jgi:hypothetical protein
MEPDPFAVFAVPARGRYETFLDDPRWKTLEDGSRTLSIFFGENADGLAVYGYQVPATYQFPAHYHRTHYMSIIVAGSLRVGRKWYRVGDIRVQEEGSVYGPEEAGPAGCTMINIFADRRGSHPSLLGQDSAEYPLSVPDILLKTVWDPTEGRELSADATV